MTQKLADRVRSIRAMKRWRVGDAACYLAGDYWLLTPQDCEGFHRPPSVIDEFESDDDGDDDGDDYAPGMPSAYEEKVGICLAALLKAIPESFQEESRWTVPAHTAAIGGEVVDRVVGESPLDLRFKPESFRRHWLADPYTEELVTASPLFNDEQLEALEEESEKREKLRERNVLDGIRNMGGKPRRRAKDIPAPQPDPLEQSTPPEANATPENESRDDAPAFEAPLAEAAPAPSPEQSAPAAETAVPAPEEHKTQSGQRLPPVQGPAPRAEERDPLEEDDREIVPGTGATVRTIQALFDPSHPLYSRELDVAMRLRLSFEKEPAPSRTKSLRRECQDRLSTKGLGLSDGLSEKACERIITVVNWNKTGGAPKT